MADVPTMTSESEASLPPASQGGHLTTWLKSISWGMLVAWLLVLGILSLIAFYFARKYQVSTGDRNLAPSFTLSTFAGDQITPQDMQDKVVVVNFWASWCKPCEQEAADLEAAWRYYQARGDVIFLGVDYVDTEPEAMQYLNKFEITYPNGPDLGTRISQTFKIIGVPETYVIDQDGNLVHSQIGVFKSLDEIKSVIDPLLEEGG
jgi:cytochrome c biogenesis protein CcmG/thiol:disulfide interchange protein DsbE